MARGIIESDVHTAADELVAKGERPPLSEFGLTWGPALRTQSLDG